MKATAYLVLSAILLLSLLLPACGGGAATTTTTTTTTTTRPAQTTSTSGTTTTATSPTATTTTSQTTGTSPRPTATTTGTTSTTTTPPRPTTSTTTTTGGPPDRSKYGGIFKTALTVGPSTPLGYPVESANDSYVIARHAIEALVSVKTGGTVIPVLATSWAVDPAAKTMTFNLRKGVKFTDGSDFNAQAVKWNYDLIIAAKKAPNFASVDVIDDYTVRITLKSYQNTDLTGMSSGAFSIISPTSFQKNGIEYTRTHPIGTGPFKFVEYQRDSKVTFTRNEGYWDPTKPYVDGLEYYVVAEETVRKILLMRGDIHRMTATGIVADDLRKQGYDYKSNTGGTFALIPDSNNANSPFADIRVRQAISYAIDREGLAQGLGFGFLRPAYQLYPGFPIAVLPNLQKQEYNPAKARELLAAAGYGKGFKTTIHTFTRVVQRDWITAIAKMLDNVGIQTTPDFPEAGKYEEYRSKGWTNALMAHGLINADNLNSIFNQYFPESQIFFPSVKKPAGFYDAMKASLTSPEVNGEKLRAVFKIMQDDLMLIPFAEEIVNQFYAPGAHDPGADEYPTVTFLAQDAWLEPSAR